MPSTYSSIGAHVESDQQYRNLIDSVLKAGEKIKFSGGSYKRWVSGDGAELWATIIGGKFRCITPFFRGKSEMTFEIVEDVERPPNTVDGAVYGWVDPVSGSSGTGAYPLAFDVVGKHLLCEPDLPLTVEIKLCACARELTAYDSEREFQVADPLRAPEYFSPLGVFGDGQRDARALFNGLVIETCEFQNALTRQRYRWILVKTFGGLVDVVFDPKQINATPQVGGII